MSKYSTITGEDVNAKFGEFTIAKNTSEGQLLTVNQKFIASAWDGSFGTIAFFEKTNYHRIKPNVPQIRAHKRYITDLRWSPFIPYLLASASEDGTIKLWDVPEEGLTKDIEKERLTYSEHGKKVVFVRFHPCSADVIASASNSKAINAWNLEGKTYGSIQTPNTLTSFEWNYNGSLLGCMCRDKNAYLYDLRGKKEAIKSKGINTSKMQKMCFLGPDNFIITGAEEKSREVYLYDIRKPASEISKTPIDKIINTLYPFYDEDTNILILASRGDKFIYFYNFENGNIKFLHNPFQMGKAPTCFTYSEKKYVDLDKNEITCMFKACSDGDLYVTRLLIPRRSGIFDETLYPPTPSTESALTGDEWASGVDKDPIKKPIKEARIFQAPKPRQQNEEKKEDVKESEIQQQKEEKKEDVKESEIKEQKEEKKEDVKESEQKEEKKEDVKESEIKEQNVDNIKESNDKAILEEEFKKLTEENEQLKQEIQKETEIEEKLKKEIDELKSKVQEKK